MKKMIYTLTALLAVTISASAQVRVVVHRPANRAVIVRPVIRHRPVVVVRPALRPVTVVHKTVVIR